MAMSREYVLLSVGLIIAVGFTVAYMLRGTNRDVARAESLAPKVGGVEWELVRPIDRTIVMGDSNNDQYVPFKIVGQVDGQDLIIQLSDESGTVTIANITDASQTPITATIDNGIQATVTLDASGALANGATTYEGYVVLHFDQDWTVDGTIDLTFVIGDRSETREIVVKAP